MERFENNFVQDNQFNYISQKLIKELIICPIFPHILKDPIQCQRCQTHFCRECINESLKMNELCPICQNLFCAQKASIILNNILEKVQVYCIHSNNGCAQSMNLLECLEHQKKCVYQLIRCKNYQCNQQYLLKDQLSHSELCDNQKQKCEYCKNEDIKRIQFLEHLEQCVIQCPNCFQKISKYEQQNHNMICPELEIKCNKCQISYLQKNANQHQCLRIINNYHGQQLIYNPQIQNYPSSYQQHHQINHQRTIQNIQPHQPYIHQNSTQLFHNNIKPRNFQDYIQYEQQQIIYKQQSPMIHNYQQSPQINYQNTIVRYRQGSM